MCELGRNVLESRDMQALRTFHQHGVISRVMSIVCRCATLRCGWLAKWDAYVDAGGEHGAGGALAA